jgi:hypothetical protein
LKPRSVDIVSSPSVVVVSRGRAHDSKDCRVPCPMPN